MPHYLHQVAYSPEGWAALLAQPQDRIEAVRPAIEKLGGRIESAWFAFGDYDIVVLDRDAGQRQRSRDRDSICRRRSL